MLHAVIILLIILSASPVHAFDDWDRTDMALLGASTLVITIDWRQTRYIAENPLAYGDLNPVLGRHPSPGSVDMYFIGALVGNALVAHALPQKYRRMWLAGTTVLSVACVGNNLGIGVGIRW